MTYSFNYIINNLLFKNIFKISSLQIISSLLTIISLPILANKFGLFFFGLIVFIQLIIKYFNWFVEWGFFTGGVQTISSNTNSKEDLQKNFNKIYSAQIILILFSILPLLFCLEFFINDIDFNFIDLSILMFFFISSASIPIWFLNGLEKVHYSVLVHIYPKLILILFLITAITNNNQYQLVFIALIIGNVFAFVHIFYVIKKLKIKYKFINPLDAIKNYFYYFISSSSLGMTNNIIPLILGLKVSIELVGIFTIAQRFISFVSLVFNPILTACFPRVCLYYSNNNLAYQDAVKKYSILILVPLSIIILIIFFLIDQIINLFFDDQYNQSIDLIIKVLPAIFINMVNCILYYFFLIPRQLDKSLMQYNVLNFISTSMIAYFMISKLSIFGAAYSLVLSEILLFLFYLFILKKNID